MANGKIIYPSGVPPGEQTTYTFPINFDYGHTIEGRINTNDDRRAFDGTLHRYIGATKKRYYLSFSKVTKEQALAFLDLWDLGCQMDLYLDGTNLDAIVLMIDPPDPNSEKAFHSGVEAYSFNVTFEEV